SLIDGTKTYTIDGALLNIYENGKIVFQKTTQYFDLGYTNVVTHPDLPYVFASSLDGKIYVYNKTNFKEIKLIDNHFAAVNDIRLSSDGKSLFSMSKDRSIIETDAMTLVFKRRFHGFSNRITSLSQTF